MPHPVAAVLPHTHGEMLHQGYVHLAGNVAMQLIFGLPVEYIHGPLRLALIYEAGVVAGALTCALFDPYSVVVGASGGVYDRRMRGASTAPPAARDDGSAGFAAERT